MASVCCQRAGTEGRTESFFTEGTPKMENTRQEPQKIEQNDRIDQLIRQAQAGEDEAFAALYRGYTPLLDRLIAKFTACGIPEAELRSVAMEAFTAAVKRFDPEQSDVTFGLYVRICIGNRLVSAQRAYRRVSETVSWDGIDPDTLRAGDESDPSHYIMEAERYADLCRKMEAVLSPAEREVWMLFISGLTAGQIAERLKTNQKAVENALFRARRKLRASFADH